MVGMIGSINFEKMSKFFFFVKYFFGKDDGIDVIG